MDWDWIIALSIATAALVLALRKSTWIVDFTVFVFVFNRGLRRLVDFYINHEFSPLSPISLTPLMVAAAMLIPSLTNFNRFPPWSRAVLGFLILAIGYAFVIGFFSVQLAAIYALAEVMAPFGLFSFVLLTQPVTRVKDRWVRSFAWAAILASAYGWFQYLTIPEWDKFWLIETKMYGYMGLPIPTQMTVFSTMAERGPLASFLGFSDAYFQEMEADAGNSRMGRSDFGVLGDSAHPVPWRFALRSAGNRDPLNHQPWTGRAADRVGRCGGGCGRLVWDEQDSQRGTGGQTLRDHWRNPGGWFLQGPIYDHVLGSFLAGPESFWTWARRGRPRHSGQFGEPDDVQYRGRRRILQPDPGLWRSGYCLVVDLTHIGLETVGEAIPTT